jgi:hypothetical protein
MDINSPSNKPRRRGRASLGCGFAVVILLFATFILFPALNDGWDGLLDAPWAHSWSGRPTLTGTWTGKFTSPGGDEFAVLLDIRRAKHTDGTYYNEKGVGAHIDGQAQWCDNQGRQAGNIPIAGSVPPSFTIGYRDHLDRVHVVLEYVDPPQGGPLPHEFNGSWQTDTLKVNPKFALADGRNLIVSSSDVDLANSITIVLKKGDPGTFDALCKKLNGRGS